MADVAASSAPRPIPAGLTLIPIDSLSLSTRTAQSRFGPLSPVAQNGHFEFDRIIKEGEVFKRTRKTKSWKSIYIVLRPHLLSIYRDKQETKLRHQVNLSDLTAVARQKDPKRKEKAVFALFSPSRNYHLEATTDKDADDWVEVIRREARLDEEEEEIYLMSPGGVNRSQYQSFGRSINTQISPISYQISPGAEESAAAYGSSSDAEGLSPSFALPKQRDQGLTTGNTARQPSFASYSGADHGSVSDLSDVAGPAARLSALSLSNTEGRPSTSSARPAQITSNPAQNNSRPPVGMRNVSQVYGPTPEEISRAQNSQEEARVVYQSWIYLLKSKSGVRQWKKLWLVIRPKGLALYKNEDEYTALLVLSLSNIIDAVEIDPISKSKTFCMQIISEERNYKFCAVDEESLTNSLGALKSLLAKKKAKKKEKDAAAAVAAVPSSVMTS